MRYVLLGSIQRAGDRLRVSVPARRGGHGRATTGPNGSDRRADDIFALQDEIALSLVGALVPGLQRAEIDGSTARGPESLDAYDLVLLSQRDVDFGMPDRVAACAGRGSNAPSLLEPSYAMAHANMAMCHHCLFLRAGLKEEHRAASIQHAREGNAPTARTMRRALALAAFSIGNGRPRPRHGTSPPSKTALTFSPSWCDRPVSLAASSWGWGGEAARAIEWSERGLRLSPLDPASAAYGCAGDEPSSA